MEDWWHQKQPVVREGMENHHHNSNKVSQKDSVEKSFSVFFPALFIILSAHLCMILQ